MTVPVSSTNRSGPFAADGVNREWTFDYKVIRAGDMQLEVYDSNGDLQVITSSQFAISGLNQNGGGIVTYPIAPTSPLPSGNTVFTQRRSTVEQPYSFSNQGAFFPELHDAAFDRLALLIQDFFLGTFGARLLSGSGAPSDINTGMVGDYYVDRATPTEPVMYGPKTTMGWGSGVDLRGPQGIQGIQGIQGDQGIQGIQGETGTGLNLKGVVAAVINLPPAGNTAGDAYLVTADGNVYIWNGSAWVDGGDLQGPQGEQGPPGDDGAPGDPATLLAIANTFTASQIFSRPAGAIPTINRNTDNTNDQEETLQQWQRGTGAGNKVELRTSGDGSNGVKHARWYHGGFECWRTDNNSGVPVTRFTRAVVVPQATLTDAATIAWDVAIQQNARVVLGGNRTMGAPTNGVAGGVYNLVVVQDAAGNRTLAFNNAIFKFPSGTEPIMALGNGAITMLSFYFDGTSYLGTSAAAFS